MRGSSVPARRWATFAAASGLPRLSIAPPTRHDRGYPPLPDALGRSWREHQKIPLVMSPDETRRLLAVTSSLKVRTLLSLGYGCGLRASEVVSLKVKNIDSAQKIIRIEQSKGRKDRNVMLSPDTLDQL